MAEILDFKPKEVENTNDTLDEKYYYTNIEKEKEEFICTKVQTILKRIAEEKSREKNLEALQLLSVLEMIFTSALNKQPTSSDGAMAVVFWHLYENLPGYRLGLNSDSHISVIADDPAKANHDLITTITILTETYIRMLKIQKFGKMPEDDVTILTRYRR